MLEIISRMGLLILLGLAIWLLVWAGRRFVESQRRRALAAAPLMSLSLPGEDARLSSASNSFPVRILAFSSTDCRQCHMVQAPALRRVVEARGERVAVVDVDAPTEQRLAQHYHILTVPSTVVLDTTGSTHAVNYGLATTQLLLQQVDEALVKAGDHCADGVPC